MIIFSHLMKRGMAALAVLCVTASLAQAQAALVMTSNTAAITDPAATSITVASATGITAPGTGATLVYLWIEAELLQVRTVSGTTLGVLRGANGTRATLHPINSLVYVVPPNAATTVDYAGACIAANQTYLPIINVRNGNIWNCATSTTGGLWQAVNLVPIAIVRSRTVNAGVAYTILPTDYAIALSTTLTGTGGVGVAVKSFTLPSHVGLAGKQLIIKDESGGLTATTKIVLVGIIDGTNSTTATVVQLVTPFGAVGLQAGSGGWFTLWCHGGNGSTTCR